LLEKGEKKFMIGNERKQLTESELGIHPIGVFKKREKKPVGKRRVNIEALLIFFSAQNVGC
jgi:hypothetical protein